MGIVFPAKLDSLSVERDQAVVTVGNAVGVTAQITEHLDRPAEDGFGVNDPVQPEEGPQKGFPRTILRRQTPGARS